jgi:hypothetical protein
MPGSFRKEGGSYAYCFGSGSDLTPINKYLFLLDHDKNEEEYKFCD